MLKLPVIFDIPIEIVTIIVLIGFGYGYYALLGGGKLVSIQRKYQETPRELKIQKSVEAILISIFGIVAIVASLAYWGRNI